MGLGHRLRVVYVGSGFSRICCGFGPLSGRATTRGRPYTLDICTRYPWRTWDPASAGFAAASDPYRAGRPQGVALARSISARGTRGVRGIRLQPDLLRLQTLCRGPARGPGDHRGSPLRARYLHAVPVVYVGSGFSRICCGFRPLSGRATTRGRPCALDICTRYPWCTWDPASAGFCPERYVGSGFSRICCAFGPLSDRATTRGRPYTLDICTRYPWCTWDPASAGFGPRRVVQPDRAQDT
jgi:hypothetical protein